MPKFRVTMRVPYITYDGVEAPTKEAAIAKCEVPPEYDFNDGSVSWVAEEEEDDDEGWFR